MGLCKVKFFTGDIDFSASLILTLNNIILVLFSLSFLTRSACLPSACFSSLMCYSLAMSKMVSRSLNHC